VIQAASPYLIVHANAAFTRLTGIQSHTIVGKPVECAFCVSSTDEGAGRGRQRQGDDSSSASEHPQTSEAHDSVVNALSHCMKTSQATPLDASRARTQALEQLITVCGNSRPQDILVATNSHLLLGQDLTIMTNGQENSNDFATLRVGDSIDGDVEKGNNESLDPRTRQIRCKVSIMPVVSASRSIHFPSRGEAKKVKKQHGTEEHEPPRHGEVKELLSDSRCHHSNQIVTHYLLQIEKKSEEKMNSSGTLSSKSASEAEVGMLRSEHQPQEPTADSPDDSDAGGNVSETSRTNPVSAIG
jgi:hypothetical protein